MDNNLKIDIKIAVQKWNPVIENITREIKEEGLQKLTKEQKLALYAEYHALNEAPYATLGGNGMGMIRPQSLTELPPVDLNKTLLPTSLKILVGYGLNNDFKNVFIVSSPKYTTSNNETVQVGYIEFNEEINLNVKDTEFEKNANRIIYEKTLNFLNSIDPSIRIFIYMVVQNVSLVTEMTGVSSTIRWRSRIAIL